MPRKNGKVSTLAAKLLGLPEIVDSSGNIKKLKSEKKTNEEIFKKDNRNIQRD